MDINNPTSTSGSSASTINVSINVSGAQSPQATAAAIANHLKTVMANQSVS